MIQVLWRKNATTTEYVIREMQTMSATRPARRAGQGFGLKTKAPTPRFWRTPGLLRVDARAMWRRSDASTQDFAGAALESQLPRVRRPPACPIL